MFISGIQQIGVGVSNVHEAFRFYNRTFGFDVPIFEEAATAGLMLPYTGGQPQQRHAILALNLQGGGGLEIWQYTGRTPQPPEFELELGDLGLYAAKLKCKSAQNTFSFLKNAEGITILSQPTKRLDGVVNFFVRDPWNNIFQIVEAGDWFNPNRVNPTGGIYGAVIGVSDIDRSIPFYRDLLGYGEVVVDQTFEDAGIGEKSLRFRQVVLRHGMRRVGPFSQLLGATEIELVQSLDRQPRKIFENRLWGDLGFIHLCFDITGMSEMKARASALGYPFTVDSSGSFDMGEAAGYFSYVEDPDGTLIEFVETHKIPIAKKIGWYLDLRKRSRPEKPLPKWLLRALGIGRVKV